VLDASGAPVVDLPVRVAPIERSGAPTSAGTWRCGSLAFAPDVFSSKDGAFTVDVDPESSSRIEAGSSWDPDGFGSLVLEPPVPETVVVRVERKAS
jgi:hypothetical protein